MNTLMHRLVHRNNRTVKSNKAFVQLLLIMSMLLATSMTSYAQSAPAGDATGANRLFLPLVSGLAASPAAGPADEQVTSVEPTADSLSDYDAISETEAAALIDAAASNFIFIVTKTADTNDGACSPSDCSLREAAAAAAADPTTHDTILLFVGVFPINGQPLQLVNVSLLGEGATKTIIEGASSIFAPPMNTIEMPMALTPPPWQPVLNTWLQLEKLAIRSSSIGNPAAGIKHAWGKLTLKNVRIQKHKQGIASAPINLADSQGIFLYNSDIDTNEKGLLIENGSASIENSVIRNSSGLGIELRQSTATLANTTLTSNGGGGLYLQKSTVDIAGSALIFNKKGAIFLNGATLTMASSTLSSNDSSVTGGGLGVDGAGATLWVGQGSTANLAFVTIAKNKVPNGTAGLYVSLYGTNSVQMRNSIVAGNLQQNGQAGDCTGVLTSGGYNLIKNKSGCTMPAASGDISGVDPKLGSLALNGGTTKNHLPASSSPAVDVIQGMACPSLSVDQRIITRPRDGNGDGIWGCDMGAVERW